MVSASRLITACGLVVLADKGYIGAGEHVHTPYQGRNKPASQKADRAHTQLRSRGERANAQLKTWHILRKPPRTEFLVRERFEAGQQASASSRVCADEQWHGPGRAGRSRA